MLGNNLATRHMTGASDAVHAWESALQAAAAKASPRPAPDPASLRPSKVLRREEDTALVALEEAFLAPLSRVATKKDPEENATSQQKSEMLAAQQSDKGEFDQAKQALRSALAVTQRDEGAGRLVALWEHAVRKSLDIGPTTTGVAAAVAPR